MSRTSPASDFSETDGTVALPRGAIPFAIAVVTFALFGFTLGHEFVNWDDDVNVLGNLDYRGLGRAQLRWMFTTTLGGHYIPFTWLTFGLDYTVWGLNPAGYHLTNVLLHAVNAAVFYLVACRLLRAGSRFSAGTLKVAAAAAALFFAVHPLRVESVAWVTERRDLLSGMFFLLTVLTYLRAIEAEGARRGRLLAGAVLCYVVALGAKAAVMTLPLVLILLDIYPLGRIRGGVCHWLRPEMRRVWLEKMPFFVLAAAGAAVSYHVVHSQAFLTPFSRYPWPARLAMAAYSLAFYLGKTALPVALSPLYELPANLDPLETRFVVSALVGIVITVLTVALCRRWPAGLAAWASYAILLGPMTGIIHSGHQLAHDRYSYLSCLGWALLIGAAAGALLTAARAAAVRPPIARAAGVAVVSWAVGLAVLSYQQISIWRNSEALWVSAIDSDPTCAVCHGNLGAYLVNNDQPGRGLAHLSRAAELRPDLVRLRGATGSALLKLGRIDEAIAHYHAHLAVDPDDQTVLTSIGIALIHKGRPADAIVFLRRALTRDDRNPIARASLDVARAMLGQQGVGAATY